MKRYISNFVKCFTQWSRFHCELIQCKHHLGIEQLERLAVLFPAYQFLLLREFQWLQQLSCKLPGVQKVQISTCCCSVECLCRSKLERQVKMKWLKHWTFLGKRKDHKSCIHLSAELNQLISKLVHCLSRGLEGTFILLLILPALCAKGWWRARFSFASMLLTILDKTPKVLQV